MTLWHILCTGT